MKIDTSKCSHGIPMEENCKECDKLLEQNKEDILQYLDELKEALENTSESDLKFGN